MTLKHNSCEVCVKEALDVVILKTSPMSLSSYIRVKEYVGWDNKLCKEHWKKAMNGEAIMEEVDDANY